MPVCNPVERRVLVGSELVRTGFQSCREERAWTAAEKRGQADLADRDDGEDVYALWCARASTGGW